jgi:hypothetical protein
VLAVCGLGLLANEGRLIHDPTPADAGADARALPYFQTRPAAYADVRSILNGSLPIRKLSFETSFLFNRPLPQGSAKP